MRTSASRSRRRQRDRDALADADAHGRERELAFPQRQFERGCPGEPRAGSAEWVAERDRAAVRIDVFGIVSEAEVAQHRQRLRREGFVQFDHVELRGRQPRTFYFGSFSLSSSR